MHPVKPEKDPKEKHVNDWWRGGLTALLGTLLAVSIPSWHGPAAAGDPPGTLIAQQNRGAGDPQPSPRTFQEQPVQESPDSQALSREMRSDVDLTEHRGLVGREIRNTDNETIGEIDNIVVGIDGRDVQAVVSVGGFWGMGDQDIIVPLDRFQLTRKRPYVFFSGTQEELESFPEYQEPAVRVARGTYPYYRYYPPQQGYGYPGAGRVLEGSRGYYRDFGERDPSVYYGEGRMPGRRTDGPRTRYAEPSGVEGKRMGRRLAASELIGKDVQNAGNETIGRVVDLIIDAGGRLALVMAVQGSEKKVRADLEDVAIDPNYVLYDISRQELQQEPVFNAAEAGEPGNQAADQQP